MNQCNESWLFRILNGATAFGEMLSQQPLRNVQNPTDIVNMLGRDLAGEVALEASPDTTTSKQSGIEYSIQRWLALRASTQSGEGRLGVSLAGPLEKKKPRSSSVPVSPPSSDADLTPVGKSKTFITTTVLAEPTSVQDIPQLTNQEKVSLIVKEFGPLTKENEEEQLLAEVDASFFQDVAILGVVHLTTHRITFHASLLNTRPDLASSKQILHSGYVDVHRVWMELMSDMITTYRSSAEEERVRPLCTLLRMHFTSDCMAFTLIVHLVSAVRKVYPLDPSHPLQVKLDSVSLVNAKKPENKQSFSFFQRFRRASHHADISSMDSVQESGPPQGTTHVIELGTIEAAFAWRKELLAALYLFSKRRNLLLSDFNKKDSDSQDSDLDSESEQGVRINIPLERIKTYKLYQW
ncbi:hypothetical protein Clacol_010253 [Clathrus columnatus]|uniref:Uncharacterized protein n=1 Tax=Clathrus columnatus TaxID=1419009 RepID=A0AAV5AMY4_9AGAM|nr:hypothetical protein Clacol_010253 [Clathrus columnatus]